MVASVVLHAEQSVLAVDVLAKGGKPPFVSQERCLKVHTREFSQSYVFFAFSKRLWQAIKNGLETISPAAVKAAIPQEPQRFQAY